MLPGPIPHAALREEYGTADHYELVHFLSASLWREIEEEIGGAEDNLWIRLLLSERDSAETMERVSNEMEQILGDSYEIQVENRIQDQMEHERAMDGLKAILGGFCGLLGLMGIANVWANAMGFVQSRRRELAQYLSIGMAPGQMWKIFSLEVLVLAVRPLALGILLSALGTMILLKVGALDFHDFRSVILSRDDICLWGGFACGGGSGVFLGSCEADERRGGGSVEG